MRIVPFCLLLLCLLPPPLRAQQLKDPGFEAAGPALVTKSDAPNAKAQISGVVADGWEDNTSWADVKVAYSLDPANAHGGKLCQKIEARRGFAQFVQPVQFAKGRYRVSLWMRAEPAQWVSVGLREGGAPYTVYASEPAKVGPKWTLVTAEGGTPDVSGLVIVNTSGAGTVWLDDAALSRAAGPSAQRLTPPKGAIPRAFFGLNANHMHDAPGYDWPALPFGTFRTWDSGVIWPTVEPQRGVYHWDELDKDVAEAERRGVKFLFTLGLTPRWAAPKGPNTYAGVSASPDDIADRRDFVRAVATRYKGRIAAYEVWNEPDLTQFYSGTPAQMVALERVTAEEVHKIDPAALVVAPAVSGGAGTGQLRWLDEYLAAGGGRYAAVIGDHFYTDPPEEDIAALGRFRAVLAAHGLAGKPVWNTESGLELARHTEQYAGGFLAREFIIDWALGLPRLCFYAYDNGSYFGLDKETPGGKDRDPAVLAPSGVAYVQMETWLTGARMLSCGSDTNGTWTCALVRSGGKRAWIAWNMEGAAACPVPASWKVRRLRGLSGGVQNFNTPPASLAVSSSPVLLEQ